jgi:hypothetical protein
LILFSFPFLALISVFVSDFFSPTHLLLPTYSRPIYLSTYPPIYLLTFSSYNRIQKSLNWIDET